MQIAFVINCSIIVQTKMATFDNSLQQLSSAAISLLAQGNTTASLGVLRHALQVVRSSCGDHSCSINRYNIEVIHLNRIFAHPVDETSSNDFDVFEGVFTVSKPRQVNDRNESSDHVADGIEILVLLYNFAFALHKAGLTRETQSERTLSKALHLYKMANACARTIPLDEHPELNTLLLALSTNQGHIHSHFLQQQEVQRFHDQIEAFLALSNPSTLLREDYLFFKQVVLLSGFAGTKLPPAA
jgi:hypothetical protein